LKRGADIRGEAKSIKCKPSPLVQGGLEIPILKGDHPVGGRTHHGNFKKKAEEAFKTSEKTF